MKPYYRKAKRTTQQEGKKAGRIN